MNESSLEHAWEKPCATVRMAQLCSTMSQLPSSCSVGIGQVAVLVQDGGERRHLLVEGEVGQPGAGTVDPALAASLEELVDLLAVGTAQIAEQLGGEIAVALGVQGLGGGGERVVVRRPAPALRVGPACRRHRACRRAPTSRHLRGGRAACARRPA